MPVILPYRSKMPPESFPVATVVLIAVNTLVYLVTTRYALSIREDSLKALAFSGATVLDQPWRILTAMFLHADPLHLIGNMLMLWIFGAAAEGRLKQGWYLTGYFLAGVMGAVLQEVMTGIEHPERFNLGASGAVMGTMGMFVYMFPYARIRVFWWLGWQIKVVEWTASWVGFYFVFLDFIKGIFAAGDGVGHLCHLGGVAAGFLVCKLVGAKKDSAESALAAKLRTDNKAMAGFSLEELRVLTESYPDDVRAPMLYIEQAVTNGIRRSVVEMLHKRESLLAEQGDAEALAHIILTLNEYDGKPPLWMVLRLADRLEAQQPLMAESLCRLALKMRPPAAGLERALLCLARVLEKRDNGKDEAAAVYVEIKARFKSTPGGMTAHIALERLGQPKGRFIVDDAKYIARAA
jgi:membrane associated rhomboid family serine protease